MNLKENLKVLIKFLMTGGANCIVDFIVINTLLFFFWTESPFFLTLYSLLGATAATINSFILNKNWTFQNPNTTRSEKIRFFSISLLGILVNTSAFLFALRQLTIYSDLTGYSLVNLSKIIAVMISAMVTFMGYRFTVFVSERAKQFREEFRFKKHPTNITRDLLFLVGIAAFVRLLFLMTNSFVYGDGVTYSIVSQKIAFGHFEEINAYWVNLYTWWEALFHLLPVSSHAATILSSFIPGCLLVVPIYLITKKLFNTPTAWIAALFTAVHPRLVAFSINGYSETFSLLLLAVAATLLIYEKSIAGIALGAYIATLNEGVLLLPIFSFFLPRKKMIFFLSSTILFLGLYVAINQETIGAPGVLQKITDFESLQILQNGKYILERIPGVLLSPLFIFALLLPFFYRIPAPKITTSPSFFFSIHFFFTPLLKWNHGSYSRSLSPSTYGELQE